MNFKEIINKNFLLKYFPLIIFVFSPKIDVISIPNYWQGIRLDDIIILIYLFFFIFKHKFKVYPNLINPEIFGFKWILFFPYLLISMIIGKIYLLNPQWIIVIRYIEYIGLIIILSQMNFKEDKVLLIFKIYILLNFFVVLLQYFELVGGFTSRGNCDKAINDVKSYCFDKEDITSICFFSCDLGFMKNYVLPGGFLNKRVPGITGGVWELSVNLSICIYALMLLEKKLYKILPYLFLVIIMLFIAQSRGIIFGFVSGAIFLLNDRKKTAVIFILSISLLLIIYFLNLFNFKQVITDRFIIDYITLTKIILGTFTGDLPLKIEILGTGLESMWYRASTWQELLLHLKNSIILTIFGSGGSLIYTESLLIRIISSFGILGSLIIVYFSKNLPLFLLVFILVTGLTVDLFISFKIFLFFCLLLIMLKKIKLN